MAAKKIVQYFLQVVQKGEEPQWPRPESELAVGKKTLRDNLMQYWAYPKDAGVDGDEEPAAEKIAAANFYDKPLLVIDQPGDEEDELELILTVDGHAWAKTESNLANLEDNITSVLEFAKDKFNLNVENFMTTKRVSARVEKVVVALEETGEGKLEEDEEKKGEEDSSAAIRSVASSSADEEPVRLEGQSLGSFASHEGEDLSYLTRRSSANSKMVVVIPVVLILILAGGALLFRHQITSRFTSLSQLSPAQPTPTVAPTTAPTPTVAAVDRSQYKVRVLNGTTTTGAAANLAADLEKLGWKVTKTGNADSSDVQQSYVRSKTSAKDAAAVLAGDVKDSYQASLSGSIIPDSDTADLEIVIGQK